MLIIRTDVIQELLKYTADTCHTTRMLIHAFALAHEPLERFAAHAILLAHVSSQRHAPDIPEHLRINLSLDSLPCLHAREEWQILSCFALIPNFLRLYVCFQRRAVLGGELSQFGQQVLGDHCGDLSVEALEIGLDLLLVRLFLEALPLPSLLCPSGCLLGQIFPCFRLMKLGFLFGVCRFCFSLELVLCFTL